MYVPSKNTTPYTSSLLKIAPNLFGGLEARPGGGGDPVIRDGEVASASRAPSASGALRDKMGFIVQILPAACVLSSQPHNLIFLQLFLLHDAREY